MVFEPGAAGAMHPEQGFNIGDQPPGFTVGDFWSWAFSDLRENVTRGLLAEFIVSRALGCAERVRSAWSDCDLVMSDGTRVEVKASAYLQAWEQKKLSSICFSRLRGRAWSGRAGFASEATYRADVYVFAVHRAVTHEEYDPLDLAQWEFFVVPSARIEALGRKTLSIASVRKAASPVVSYAELASALEAAKLASQPVIGA